MASNNSQTGKVKKYIFITGGVTSSLGKGLAAASIAFLLERRGLKINMLKMDPYINVDPGTMSPIEHGEVFVTDDGAETDLDLGHYERFTSLSLMKRNNFTTGQIYLKVIENERVGKYLGNTVQVVPHITDEIKRRIHLAAEDVDLLIGEIGGTVGDIESQPFLEAIRQFAHDVGPEHVLFVHLVLVPYISAAGELKSKPAQHSVKELRSLGLFPHIILCRSDRTVGEDIRDKIALFCNVPKNCVYESTDQPFIARVPLLLHDQGMDSKIVELLNIWTPTPDMSGLQQLVYNAEHPEKEIKIAMVGKYMGLKESYKSLSESLFHAATSLKSKLIIDYMDAESLENLSDKELIQKFSTHQGILVPGGFGSRGTEGKINAIRIARTQKIPYLGICLGMQLAIIEVARFGGIKKATSQEFNSDGDLVIHYLVGQSDKGPKGATMRLGAYECEISDHTLAKKIYDAPMISERHRHRLEVNNKYREKLQEFGLVFSGLNQKLNLVEITELKDHPYFIGCQYHPEFKSKLMKPHPLFASFLQASSEKK
ncbi:MAG: CTP synthase [Bacteriovoracaceae bacterium]|nr:CTP synthase [Bacteriovoracaceae bacterium]